jgi:hypothetical protein
MAVLSLATMTFVVSGDQPTRKKVARKLDADSPYAFDINDESVTPGELFSPRIVVTAYVPTVDLDKHLQAARAGKFSETKKVELWIEEEDTDDLDPAPSTVVTLELEKDYVIGIPNGGETAERYACTWPARRVKKAPGSPNFYVDVYAREDDGPGNKVARQKLRIRK